MGEGLSKKKIRLNQVSLKSVDGIQLVKLDIQNSCHVTEHARSITTTDAYTAGSRRRTFNFNLLECKFNKPKTVNLLHSTLLLVHKYSYLCF